MKLLSLKPSVLVALAFTTVTTGLLMFRLLHQNRLSVLPRAFKDAWTGAASIFAGASDGLDTCEGRRLERGYIMVMKNWEQQTAGSASLMSLQCWAASINMVVVELFMETSQYGIPDELLANATAKPQGFVRLSQMYDIDYWNKYSRDECYAPLVNWEHFLCNAPRDMILVYVLYTVLNTQVISCPLISEEIANFQNQSSSFLNAHGFRIIRGVCLQLTEQKLSTEEFSAFILGNYTASEVTVVINEWRGLTKFNGPRLSLTDTDCDWHTYRSSSVPFARPSRRILEDVSLYREQKLNSKDYIAVMVRFEIALQSLHNGPRWTIGPRWTVNSCLESVISAWNELKVESNLSETFWSLDVGAYGTIGYSQLPWKRPIAEQVLFFMEDHYNVSYSEVEESLTEVSGMTNRGYIALLQQSVAVRAKCLLLIGGGTFQEHAASQYNELHQGNLCIVVKDTAWLTQKCM